MTNKATAKQQGYFCHLLHSSGLYGDIGIDGVKAMQFAAGLYGDTIGDLIDALEKYDQGTGDMAQKGYIVWQIQHLIS